MMARFSEHLLLSTSPRYPLRLVSAKIERLVRGTGTHGSRSEDPNYSCADRLIFAILGVREVVITFKGVPAECQVHIMLRG